MINHFKQELSQIYEIERDELLFSTDKNKIDIYFTHQFILNCYWARGRTLQDVEKSIDHSLCYGVYTKSEQIGFARIVSDLTTCALLCDLFIDKTWQGKGIGKELLRVILESPLTENVKFWCLATRDAQDMYKKFNFSQNSRLMCKVVS